MKRKSSRKGHSTKPIGKAEIPRDSPRYDVKPWKDYFARLQVTPTTPADVKRRKDFFARPETTVAADIGEESWADFFNRLQAAGGRLSAADVERLIHFWKTWPGRWAEAYPGTNACVLLDLQHGAATRLLMAEAEWRGMDSGPLATSARLCLDALTQSPDVGNWPNPGRGTWPECLEAAKKVTMRPDQAAALRAAEVLLERLAAVAGAEQGVELITLAQAVRESNISRTTVRMAVKAGRLTDYRPADKRGTTSPLILDRAEVKRLVSRTCVKKKPASK